MLERLEVDLTKIRIFPVLKPDFLPAMQILHFGTTRFGLSITWEFQNRKACPRDIQNANLALASLWCISKIKSFQKIKLADRHFDFPPRC